MKLFIIVICMLLERYGEHFERLRYFQWFKQWSRLVQTRLSKVSTPVVLVSVLFPILFVLWFIRLGIGAWFFGGLDMLLEGVVFFFCLGPQNLFYSQPSNEPFDAELYFEKVNRQWFGVMFWYIVAGIWGAVIYRLLDLVSQETQLEALASKCLQYLDWIPARLTALLYLLVGNFQQPYTFLLGNWWTGVGKNQTLLAGCGLRAIGNEEQTQIYLADAQQLVWRALILFLACLALLTLAAWL